MQEAQQNRLSFESVAVWVVGLIAPLATLLFVPSASVSFLSTKVTLIALLAIVALIAFCVSRMLEGNIPLPPLPLLGAVWLLPIAYLLSALFSGTSLSRAFFGTEFEVDTLGFVFVLALLATLGAFVLRRAKDFRLFFVALLTGIGVLVISQFGFIIVSKLWPSISPLNNIVGSFIDVGMLAGLALIFAMLAERSLALSKRARTLLLILSILSLLILILVNSVILFGIVGVFSLALFVETLIRRKKQHPAPGTSMITHREDASSRGRFLAVPLVTLLVSVFFLIGGSTVGSAIVSALGVNNLDVRPSWQSTFSVGGHTFASSPLFGSGPGTFGEEWLQFRDRTLNDSIFWSIDFVSGVGYIPTSFVTTGVAGVIAWILLIGLFLFAGIRALLLRMPTDPALHFATLASYIGSAYVLLLALLTNPGLVVLAIGFLSLGVFVSVSRYGRTNPDSAFVFADAPRIGFIMVFFLTLLSLGAVGGAYLVSERYIAGLYYGQAATALAAGNVDTAASALQNSLAIAKSDRSYQLSAALGVARMRKIASDTTLAPSVAKQQFQDALTGSINAGLAATELNPKNYQNWTVLAGVYQTVTSLHIDGAYEAAKNAFQRAQTLNPTSPVIPYVLAQLEITQGNTEIAEQNLLASVNLKRDYIPAILLLSQLEIQRGKATEALQAAEAAAYFAPNDASVLFEVGILRSGTGDIPGAVDALSRAVSINPQYANARYFLGAMYAAQGKYSDALTQLQFIAGLSEANAAAVKDDIAALSVGKNPWPPARLRSLGIPTAPVQEPTPAGAK